MAAEPEVLSAVQFCLNSGRTTPWFGDPKESGLGRNAQSIESYWITASANDPILSLHRDSGWCARVKHGVTLSGAEVRPLKHGDEGCFWGLWGCCARERRTSAALVG
eukprot:2736221-Rhodomonas_salina.1